MAPLEELSFEQRGDVVVAQVRGEVDLSNVPSVRQQLLHAVSNQATALVLDLSVTDYLDSTGVRLIFELADRLGNRGQKLLLAVPVDSIVNRVLTLTEVHRVVPMAGSVDAALRE